MKYFGCTIAVILLSCLGGICVAKSNSKDSLEIQIEDFYPQPTLSVTSHAARVAIDTKHQRVYIADEGKLSILDLTKLHSEPKTIPLKLSISDFVMDYDTVGNRLLFWSRGIGQVYELNDHENDVNRLDRSFDQKNQFGHSASLHPSDGQLFAFGGYGLWMSKNYITRYDDIAKEWFLVDDKHSEIYPNPRSHAYTTWQTDDYLLMIGGGVNQTFVPNRSPAQSNDSKTLWQFHYPSGTWKVYKQLNLPDVDLVHHNRQKFNLFSNLYSYAKKQDIWFVIGLLNKEGEQKLIAIETNTGRSKILDLPQYNIGRNKILLGYSWDDKNDALVLVGVANTAEQEDYPLFISKIHISDWDTFIADMQSANNVDIIGFDLAGSSVTFYVLLVIILIFSGGILSYWFLVKRGRHSSAEKEQNSILSPPDKLNEDIPDQGLYLHYQEGEAVELYYFGLDLTHFLTGLQCQIILYFFIQTQRGQQFHSIDELEEVFWSDQQNRDYVRKLRNREFNRIHEVVNSHAPEQYQPLIINRKDPQDLRRLEYGLNTALIEDKLVSSSKSCQYWRNLVDQNTHVQQFNTTLSATFAKNYLQYIDL